MSTARIEEPPTPPKRPTIRVKQPRTSAPAVVSLCVAAVIALGFYGTWRLWHVDQPAPAPHRSLSEFIVTWRCDRGHYYLAPVDLDVGRCHTCGKPAVIVDDYACAKHGPFEVAVRLEMSPTGRVHPAELRVGDDVWQPANEDLPCPKCARPLRRPAKDPLAFPRAGPPPDRR